MEHYFLQKNATFSIRNILQILRLRNENENKNENENENENVISYKKIISYKNY